MSLWVSFHIEVLDDPPFVALEAADPAHPWRWMRIIQFAKRANEKGRVLRADGRPVTARDLALAHDRSTSTEPTWEGLLSACLEEGLLVNDSGTYHVVDWARWHRKPSDDPESIRERVARHRASRADVTDVTPVTRGNACNASQQSRAEQSTAVPPCSPPEGDGSGAGDVLAGTAPSPNGNGKRNWAQVAVAALAEHLPGELSPQERRVLGTISTTGGRVGAPPLRAIDAIRTAAQDVALELQLPGNTIRYPKRVALERALADVTANPLGPVPNPWDVDKQRGADQ